MHRGSIGMGMPTSLTGIMVGRFGAVDDDGQSHRDEGRRGEAGHAVECVAEV
jgi:hypothetical protein